MVSQLLSKDRVMERVPAGDEKGKGRELGDGWRVKAV